MIFKTNYLLNLYVLDTCGKHIHNSRLGLMIKRLLKSLQADGIFPERLDEHDEFFVPKTEEERVLWENLRESAKIQVQGILASRANGRKGGRPVKRF